jgi:type II secretory pathway pseudopilin PulG
MQPIRRAYAFIELLVCLTIISIMMALLLPALSGALRRAREVRCLANLQQVGQAMTLYSDSNADHLPMMPVPYGLPHAPNQFIYGGLAGLFSLNQRGTGAQPGFTGGAYVNGVTEPLLASYLTSFEGLVCPADRMDRYYGMPYAPNGNMSYAAAMVMQPTRPGSADDVVSYNISYMYVPSGKSRGPAVLWMDETNGPDINEFAWYGPRTDPTANTSPNSIAAGSAGVGFYAPDDNHGADGANVLISDGHAYFHRGHFTPRLIID